MKKIDILVTGTERVNPYDPPEVAYGKFGGQIPCDVTGCPNVVAITSGDFKLIYDSGDLPEVETLKNSLKKTGFKPRYVMAGHTHPDHFANNYVFPEADWFIPEKDDAFESIITGTGKYSHLNDSLAAYGYVRKIYAENYKKFNRLDPSNLPKDWPDEIQVLYTEGHHKGHQSILINEPVRVRQIDKDIKHEANRVIIAGDTILNKEYSYHFFNKNFEHAILCVNFYSGTPEEKIHKNMNIMDMKKLFDLVEDGLIIPGHGEPFYI